MRRITELAFAACVAAGLAAASPSLAAQGAYLADASVSAADDAPGEYLYRLEIAYREGRPEIEMKIGFDDAPGDAVASSVLVKPLGKDRSEVLLRFISPSGGEPSFPGMTLSWMAERLVVPPRPSEARRETADGKGAAEERDEGPPRPWKNAVLPPGAGSARAVGSFSLAASLDRDKASPGDTAFVEFRLVGTGDFSRARPPSLRILSGEAALGTPRRYPDYDPESGKGALLFRFPLRIEAAGSLRLEVLPYPVYDARERAFLPGEARSLSLAVEAADEARAGSPAAETGTEAKAEKGVGARNVPACATVAACAILAGLLAFLGFKAGGRRRILLSACAACSASAALAVFLAFPPRSGSGADKTRRSVIVSGLDEVYSVPSLKARSWKGEGGEARIAGELRDGDGRSWMKVVFEDSQEGWILLDGSGTP